MALLANDRDGLEFSHHQYPGGGKITPALEGPDVWSPLAIEGSACTRGLSFWAFCYENGQISQALVKGLMRGRQRGIS
jgi:hypothetical protein